MYPVVAGDRWFITIDRVLPERDNGIIPTVGENVPMTILYATSADGKTPHTGDPTVWNDARTTAARFNFRPFPHEEGEKVLTFANAAAAARPTRLTYLAKTAPIFTPPATADDAWTFTPSSKVARLRVTSVTRPVLPRVDYRREVMTLRAGMAYRIGTASPTSMGTGTGVALATRENARAGIPFNTPADAEPGTPPGLLANIPTNEQRVPVTVWTEANGRSPQSFPNEIFVYGPSALTTNVVRDGINAGIRNAGTPKVSFKLPRGYEVRPAGEADAEWSTTITVSLTMEGFSTTATTVNNDNTWQVRRMGTARFMPKNTSGPDAWISGRNLTTSAPLTLKFNYKGVNLGTTAEANWQGFLNSAVVE
jgi:hypothetical protein